MQPNKGLKTVNNVLEVRYKKRRVNKHNESGNGNYYDVNFDVDSARVFPAWTRCAPPGPIDFVFTWVNGSNPELQKNYTLYVDSKPQRNRFTDIGQLKYALRSIEKNAQWFNHIYIGQFRKML